MQRSYSIFIMLKPVMWLSVSLEFSNNALGFSFFLLIIPLFQPRIPAALCALQNYIQEIDQDEGEIPTDSQQAAYEPFSSDVSSGESDYGGLITDEEEGSSEIKSRRMNIGNEMWVSYLQYTADSESDGDDDDTTLDSEE